MVSALFVLLCKVVYNYIYQQAILNCEKIMKKTHKPHSHQTNAFASGKISHVRNREKKGTNMNKKQFVESLLSETISIASGRGEYGWVAGLSFNEETEVVTIHCRNGHFYKVSVFADSHLAIIEDVMKEVMKH